MAAGPTIRAHMEATPLRGKSHGTHIIGQTTPLRGKTWSPHQTDA